MTKQIEDWRSKIRWSADFYKSLSDDECVICLTQKQIYLIGQVIEPLTWSNTRWFGDKSGLDFASISEELAYRIQETMSCETLSQIATQITNLQLQINEIANETIPPEVAEEILNNTITDEYTQAELDAFDASVDVCDTAGKDAIYGACNAIVRHINQTNIDALEKVSQAGNVPNQISTVISGLPVIGLLPFDEAFAYASFIAEELLDEYDATVTEELLQTCICDLFCIAVANDCSLGWHDLINYYGSKIGTTGLDVALALANVVNFALVGTFSGDDYFYYLSLFQLLSVAIADSYFGSKTIEFYSIVMKTGLNSPDNDWSLLCDECPQFYRRLTYDFATGLNGWSFATAPGGSACSGTVLGVTDGSNGLKGVNCGNQQFTIGITHPFDPTWRIHQVKMYTFRENGQGSGTFDHATFKMRPTIGSDAGSFNPIQGGFRPNGQDDRCGENASSPFYYTGANQLFVSTAASYNSNTGVIHLQKIEILFEVLYADETAVMTTDELC